MKKKVILTGFSSFGDYDFNPTEDCANYYKSHEDTSCVDVISLVLPCTYFGAFEILSKVMDYEKPDATISMGLSSGVKGVRIETTFRNLMNGKYPDADHHSPKSLRIIKGQSAEFISSTAKNIFLANLLYFDGIPVEVSGDADTYVCNSLGYLTSKKIRDSDLLQETRNMFIHIPWTDDYKNVINLDPSKIFLKKESFYYAVKLLIKNI